MVDSAQTTPVSTPTVTQAFMGTADDPQQSQTAADIQAYVQSQFQGDPQSLPPQPMNVDDGGTQPSSLTQAQMNTVLTTVAPSVPLAVDQATDTLNPAYPSGGTAKEVREPSVTLERPAVDQVPGVQYVETEKNAELPPEVDGFLKKVENHQEEIPHEVVIADSAGVQPTTKYLAQPVVVLPITADVEKVGASKSPKFSVRWLVEWSHKVMKMFAGKVIYREVQ